MVTNRRTAELCVGPLESGRMRGNPRRIKPLPRLNAQGPEAPGDRAPVDVATGAQQPAKHSVSFALDGSKQNETAYDKPPSTVRSETVGTVVAGLTSFPKTNGMPRGGGTGHAGSPVHPGRAFATNQGRQGSMVFGNAGYSNASDVDGRIVTINCGGTQFQTFVKTLRRIPKTRLYRMAHDDLFLCSGYVFLDRNPLCFGAVLEYCRSDRLDKPYGVSEEMWKEELVFYNIHSITHYGPPNADENPLRPDSPLWKVALWDFLEDPATSGAARIYSCTSLVVVLIATFFFVIESMQEFSSSEWQSRFVLFEAISIYFFTAEYVGRLTASERRRTFVMSTLNLVDLGAILPYYITLALPASGSGGLGVLRVVRLTKVFRVLRIGKYSKGLQLLLQTVAHSAGELSVMGLFLFIGVLLFGSFVYMTDSEECSVLEPLDECDDSFDSIPKGMWWAIVTLSTVGYGDAVPKSPGGKIVAAIAICVGILMLAGPVAVMASTFGARYHENTAMEKKRLDGERQHRNMVRIAKMRGKHAFWQNLQMVLFEEAGSNTISLPAYRRLMAELFKKFDTDQSGALDFIEIKEAISTMGVEMPDVGLRAMMDEADTSRNGSLDIQEFTFLITQAALENEGSDLPPHFADLLKSALQQLKPAQNSHTEDEEASHHGSLTGSNRVGHTLDGGVAYNNLRPVVY